MDLSTSKPITVDLPERATIFELTMTSPTEGWLVGAVFAPDHRTLESGLIMRYHDYAWRPIDDPLRWPSSTASPWSPQTTAG